MSSACLSQRTQKKPKQNKPKQPKKRSFLGVLKCFTGSWLPRPWTPWWWRRRPRRGTRLCWTWGVAPARCRCCWPRRAAARWRWPTWRDASASANTGFSRVSWSSLPSPICRPARSHLLKAKQRARNSIRRKVKVEWRVQGCYHAKQNKRTKSYQTKATAAEAPQV